MKDGVNCFVSFLEFNRSSNGTHLLHIFSVFNWFDDVNVALALWTLKNAPEEAKHIHFTPGPD